MPPVNDLYANRIALSGDSGSYGPILIVGATNDATDPTDMWWGSNSLSIFYEWTPSTTGKYIIELDRVADGTTLGIDFYSGSPGAWGTRIIGPALGGNAGVFHAERDVDLVGGTTYIIVVSSALLFGTSDDYTLSWHPYVAPPGSPTNDDIGDAFVMVPTSSWQSHNFTVDNATNETNEDTERWDFPVVWGVMDLSSIPGHPYGGEDSAVDIEIKLEVLSGDVSPWLYANASFDPTFDPDSPDFSMLDYDLYDAGNGTQGPITQVLSLQKDIEGIGDSIYYFALTDSYENLDDLNGEVRVSWRIADTEWFSLAAAPYANLSSPTVTVVGDEVRESQKSYVDPFINMEDSEATVIIPGSDLPSGGLWELWLRGYFPSGTAFGDQDFLAIAKRNDLPVSDGRATKSGIDGEFVHIYQVPNLDTDNNSIIDVDDNDNALGHPPYMLILPDDEIKINIADSGASYYGLTEIAFRKVEDASAGPTFGGVVFEDDPVGFPRFSQGLLNYGGDETNFFDYDFVAMPNGDIYATLLIQGFFSDTPPYPIHGVRFFKWTEATSTWSVENSDIRITPGVTGDRSPLPLKYQVGGISMATDGTDVYIIWWEGTGVNLTVFTGLEHMLWHCKKYEPSTATFTELGTGQANFAGPRERYENWPRNFNDGSRIAIEISPNGDPYVAFTETVDTAEARSNSGNDEPYLYKWNGSTWVNCGLPKPVESTYEIEAVYGPLCKSIDLTFCHHDGPSNTPSVIYMRFASSAAAGAKWNFHYQEYDGTSWDNLLRFSPYDIFGSRLSGGSGQKDNTSITGHSLINDGVKPIWINGIWCAAVTAEIIDAMMILPDGSAFVPLDDDVAAGQISIWGYGNGEAAIGPDNKPWYSFHHGGGLGVPESIFSDNDFVARYEPKAGQGGYAPAGPNSDGLQDYLWDNIAPRIRWVGDKIYVMSQGGVYDLVSDPTFSTDLLGIWIYRGNYDPEMYIGYGPTLGAVNLSRIRFRAHQVGDA